MSCAYAILKLPLIKIIIISARIIIINKKLMSDSVWLQTHVTTITTQVNTCSG